MAYSQKFELVTESLIDYCKECIIENWERSFNMWLKYEADMVFGYGYQNKFKEQFNQYMNSEIEWQLYLAGKHIVFAINAFMAYNNTVTLSELLIFIEKFICEQLDDFDNWCSDIGEAICDEFSEQGNTRMDDDTL